MNKLEVLRKFTAVFFVLFLSKLNKGFCSSWLDEEAKKEHRQYWIKSHQVHLSPQCNDYNSFTSLHKGFNKLHPYQRPIFLPAFHGYYRSKGKLWIFSRKNTFISEIKLFDAENRRTNLIMRGDGFNYTFAFTQRKKKEKRKHPKLNFKIPISLQPFRENAEEHPQAGHGGDVADSRDRMAEDPLDFMPQYEFYNEIIRNPLVRTK